MLLCSPDFAYLVKLIEIRGPATFRCSISTCQAPCLRIMTTLHRVPTWSSAVCSSVVCYDAARGPIHCPVGHLKSDAQRSRGLKRFAALSRHSVILNEDHEHLRIILLNDFPRPTWSSGQSRPDNQCAVTGPVRRSDHSTCLIRSYTLALRLVTIGQKCGRGLASDARVMPVHAAFLFVLVFTECGPIFSLGTRVLTRLSQVSAHTKNRDL